MPQNCSTDLRLVADYIDDVLAYGTPKAKNTLKAMFGLEGLPQDSDFAEYAQPSCTVVAKIRC